MAKLYLISTPIGNLADITYRAKEILEQKSLFFAEDSRSLKNLLTKLGIDFSKKEINSYHDHSADVKIKAIIEYLKRGDDVCYLSEAGSPIISDPAYPLVAAVIDNGLEIESIPGTSSVIVALEMAGLPVTPFSYYGFLSRSREEQSALFREWNNINGTKVFFEAGGRLIETLELLSKQLPSANIVVARELTKMFQSVYRFKASEFAQVKDEIVIKGEFVVLVHNNICKKQIFTLEQEALTKLATDYLEGSGKRNKILSKIFALILNRSQNEIYSKLTSGREE
ncbi:MAG: 16S rRNA (cytidine(1402)-2'-O)-methyltransferase [Bdellovibrionales bacterium RIFOXYD12_FULL_39_22]|nr:MAG: 16S rRNA (cytidine(1402)-2'-O)-methyltransferase [Bdellovibrionales bacterium RIFOXYB1_FULL_39_21]OFZ45006.1 MAG: 16S rRNA (cytidine(1402)-2'-O)-methyltransferase [Bdellovibrionales bacterium RIFOXYC12_FULL_39_17]OFZ49444.1 MAG: 16S rRNA (cytidine(1402)-2'-O)-methyltransferase [Bdellovibrionales bacterium RIFOXYC1_FULL_39_130]OFZ73276.1 MAG: 16S rRNA (cytidine(1402)-2'-O)-methyltransferase [Bdellovibrionales bacterium RIFOXYC2_FULL_39_8]OFZ77183.1 MAG: 16S rRNA (cytidine(1402)-2'-O)-met